MSIHLDHLARDTLLWLSAFSAGSALFSASLCLRMVKLNPRRYGSFAAAKIGYAIVIGIVLLRILLPLESVIPDAWTWAYAFGLAVAGVGYVGVGRAIRAEFIEWEAEKKGPPESIGPQG